MKRVILSVLICGLLLFTGCSINNAETFRAIGISVLFLIIIIFLLLLFRKNRNEKKQLEFEKAMFETIFNSAPDVVFCKDLDLNFMRFNKRFEEYFCNRESGINLSVEMLEKFKETDSAVIKNNQEITTEEYIVTADGTGRFFEIKKTPLLKDGVVFGMMGLARDITHRKEAEEAAYNASRAKSEFLSRTSHEIRTPLNAIIGMNTDDIEKKDHCFVRADNASKNLLEIINDILDMSKIEANKFELAYSEFNFERILMDITNVVNVRVEEKHQNFIVNLSKEVPMYIESDELRLSQVIMNLLTNAIKFTPENGTVMLNIEKTDELNNEVILKIEVVDSGIGISQEQQKRLFTSFEQADAKISQKFGGTGLGLAISKRIVELMGGRIWIESELGHGAKFIFTIKAKKLERKIQAKLLPNINKDNLRILAVDDSVEVREYFINVMESINLPCEVVESGPKAIEMILNEGDRPYNLIFVDWQMPEMDGIELTQQIKLIKGEDTIIIMISVADWNVIEKEATAAGVKYFLPKPLFPSTLINAINFCIGVDANENSDKSEDTQYDFAGHTILIAEDIEINREIVAAILERTNVSVEFAENGNIAVNMFSENPNKYSLIFMDVHMPEMDGYEATTTIRGLEFEKAKEIPIIAMTANAFKEDIEKCLAVGMNDHIGKPIDIDILYEKINQYIKI